MHRFSRMHLSPAEALKRLDAIDLEEKSAVAEGIALVAVVDERHDYLAAGYSCMKNYCMGHMRMSEDRAYRRIQVARVALKFPEVFECLADGRLTVTTASTLAPHLTAESAVELLTAAAFKSRPEILGLITARAQSVASMFALNVQESSGSLAPVQVSSNTNCGLPTTCAVVFAEHAPNRTSARRGRVSANPAGGFDVRLALTPEEHEVLAKAQALLGHAVPSGDPAEIYGRAMKHYLAHLEKQRFGVKPGAAPAKEPRGRGIPKALRRLVWERDGRCCSFVSADGHRCEESFRLEIDHIVPRALGGKTTLENLRVLCRAHNQFEAERMFGKEHVRVKRELAQRERARAKAAAKASAGRETARAKATQHTRSVALQARYEDLHGALRGLGYRDADARRGAALADDMPDAPLEACLRRALTELSRPVALRGERMARSTA